MPVPRCLHVVPPHDLSNTHTHDKKGHRLAREYRGVRIRYWPRDILHPKFVPRPLATFLSLSLSHERIPTQRPCIVERKDGTHTHTRPQILRRTRGIIGRLFTVRQRHTKLTRWVYTVPPAHSLSIRELPSVEAGYVT
jgi:hypothetical protein